MLSETLNENDAKITTSDNDNRGNIAQRLVKN
jgi:hypothetical protein